jgi:2-polyprenyl-3-methyl-5-hydroxy-6-metoxy-1,4-benzoquinol methylase
MEGIETVYNVHHKGRGEGFAILMKERGEFLRRIIGTGKKVLDIGCRDGQLTSQYAFGNDVAGADIDSEALARAEKNLNIKTFHVDLNKDWEFEKNSYDVVVACEFLEHIYFPEEVMKKVKALLKPGGIFVGTIPHAYSVQSRIKFLLGTKKGTPLEDPTHINHFTYLEFKNMLDRNFEMIEIDTYVPKRYQFIAKLFPYAFAHDLMFAVRKNPLN